MIMSGVHNADEASNVNEHPDTSRPSGSQFLGSEVLSSGAVAAWWRSPWIPGGLTLDIDGAEQSTVFPDDQSRLLYDYLQWMQAALQLWTPRGAGTARGTGESDRAGTSQGTAFRAGTYIHLGGGGLSLPRALAVAEPASTHIVVDLDPDLIDTVLAKVPFPGTNAPHVIAGDVRDALPHAVEVAGVADALVLDISIEPDSPARLFDPGFMTEMFDAVVPGGLVLINIGDEPGLEATRRMADSLKAAGASYFVAADSSMFSLTMPGNVVLGARRSPAPFTAEELAALHAAGPRPGTVLSPGELAAVFAGRTQ